MKRGQAHLTPIYILGAIIIVLILSYGYSAATKVSKQEKQISSLTIINKLKSDVKEISSEYGTVKNNEYSVPEEVKEVCFYDKDNNPFLCGSACSDLDIYSLIKDNVEDIDNNVFFVTSSIFQSLNIEEIKLDCCTFHCVENTNGKIKLRLEGKGDSTLVS